MNKRTQSVQFLFCLIALSKSEINDSPKWERFYISIIVVLNETNIIRYLIQSNCVVFITGFYELNIPHKWCYESAQIIYQMPEIAPILRDFFLY